jgi:UDP-glucuronate decarboxylase
MSDPATIARTHSDRVALRNGARRRILVTGGAGFIGSHLCERLLDEGHEVLCVDNFYSTSKANIEHLLGNPRFELMRHDVTFPLYVEVDQIYHLACPASPIHYQRDPVQTTKTSVHGSINMLGLAKRLKAPILLTSTSEIYGDPEVHPQSEEYWGHVNPIGPRSCYDEGKRCAETLFFDYRRQHDMPTKVVRLFNTYGPRMQPDDGRVVSNFIMQALAGDPLTVYGGGEQTRSFCYVDDTVDAIIRMMATPHGVSGPMNIGNPHEITVGELAERILRLVGSGSTIQYLPLPTDDPRQRRPDITRARETLLWEPRVPLEVGLADTVNWFAERFGLGTAARRRALAAEAGTA